MAKGKRKQRSKAGTGRAHQAPARPVLTNPRQLEEYGAKVIRLGEEHGIDSDEEMAILIQDLIRRGNGRLPDMPPRTPLEEAQGLFYRALEAKGRRRIELARKAVEVSPDCADAYVLLAEETGDPKQARPLYEQAVAAAERAIGPERFAREVGSFWNSLETRPYIRALEGLADVRWLLGERQESIGDYQELLRLDSDDHQGVRYRLAARLMIVGDDAALRRLMDRFPDDDSASWAYSRALMLFRRHGAGRRSLRALAQALEANPYVPAYLLGLERIPRRLPEVIEAGEASEAIEYVVEAVEAWAETPGAVEWLADLVDSAMTELLDDDPPELFLLPGPPNLPRLPRR